QLNQSRALQLGVEWFRSLQPRCMGTLYWQLNDCWPGATSWSCIDGDGKLKPLWYATRRFFAPSIATIQPEPDGSLHLNLLNDTDEPGAGTLWVARRNFAGEVLAEQEIACESAPRSVGRWKLNELVATPADPSSELITVGSPTHATWFFAPDKDLKYPPATFEANFVGGRLTIVAKSLLRDVCIFVDRLDPDATISDQLITLLPDESFTFKISSKQPLTLEQLTLPPVFRCANEFGRKE
ncbi:MAG: glycoside hydrolase family 2 protein, partial [Acidobacteria bacterium]|nr:glycoside hydrolase family 2 protein [Acidobacteriota bacterium]